MSPKVKKKLKKLGAGFTFSSIAVFIVIFFFSAESPVQSSQKWGVSMDNIFYDAFFKISTSEGIDENEDDSPEKKISANKYDPNIVIVDIDEPSLDKLGQYNQWDRSIHTEVVKNLTEGGAAAIGFDILFKNADFGQKEAKRSTRQWNNYRPEVLQPTSDDDKFYIYDSTLSSKSDSTGRLVTQIQYHDSLLVSQSLFSKIQQDYNYDSMLVDAVKVSKNTIACFLFVDENAYWQVSQWYPLSTSERAESLGDRSNFDVSKIDKPGNIEAKKILDDIFPELANAATHIGSVNAFPDDDGVLRHVELLYRFPDPNVFPEEPSRVYSTMPLMAILHLFHQDPKNVVVKMGQYIDIGRPFSIYKDNAGNFQASFPGFTYPMFQALRQKVNEIKDTQNDNQFIDVTSKLIAVKNEDEEFSFEIFDGQVLEGNAARAILNIDSLALSAITEEDHELAEGITIKRDEENPNLYVINDEEEGEEYTITPYIVSTLQYYKDSLENLPVGHRVHLSMDLDINFDLSENIWKSNMVIISDDVIKDIAKVTDQQLENLKPGEEIRFGNVKRIPIDKDGRYQVNFHGRYGSGDQHRAFQHLSYYNVYKNRTDPAFYQGKIFILGSAATALFDYLPAPHEENYPGVLVHANIIQNILNDQYLRTLTENYQIFITIIMALICVFIGLYLRSYISTIITILLCLIYIYIAYRYFQHGLYIGATKQIIAMIASTVVGVVVQFYYETREKRFLGNAFKQYISPELIDEMVNKEIMPTLGGRKSQLSAFFTDIASFSTFSEKIGDPSRLVELLNEYLTSMTDTLLHNKGTLDKYEGDAIIAFFGAPMPLENHAQSACETAVDMQEKLMKLRKKWKSEGDKWPTVVHDMHMRIGINSGDIVTGNMGSTTRKNYTMMGDAVNLAARLESAAKQYGAYIQISEDTEKDLKKEVFVYRSLDTIRVIGKSKPVKTFEILARSGRDNEAALRKLVEIWEKARTHYLAMEWDKAIELFTLCLDLEPHHPDRDPGSKTTPSHVYIKRCMEYKQKPPVEPGEEWDGVFTATQK